MANTSTNPVLAAAGVAKAETPPTPKADKLVAIQKQLEESSVRTAGTIEQAKQTVLDTERTTGILTDAVHAATEASKIITATKNTAALTAQNKTIDAIAKADASNLQSTLLKTQTDLTRRSQELQAEVLDIVDDEHTGVGIIDNIINQFRYQSAVAERNTVDHALAKTTNQLAAIAQSSTAIAQTNALTKKTLNEASIAADLKLIEAEGKIKGAEADLNALSSNAKAYSALAQADAQHSANLREAYALQGTAEDRVMRRAQFDRLREKWAKQDVAEAEKDQLETTLATAVQQGAAVSGVAIPTKQEALWGLSQGGTQGAKYTKYYEMGSEAQPVLGNSAAEARDTLAVVSPNAAYRKTKGTELLQTITLKQQDANSAAVDDAPKNAAQEQEQFNAIATKTMNDFAANVVGDTRSNPYAAPPMDTLAEDAVVKGSVLYQKVLQGTQLSEADPVVVTREALASINDKTITAEDAADGVIALYQAAADYNNTVDGGFARYGLPEQTSYITTLDKAPNILGRISDTLDIAGPVVNAAFPIIKIADKFSGSTKVRVDLLDRTAVMSYFISELSAMRSAGSVSSNVTTANTANTDQGSK